MEMVWFPSNSIPEAITESRKRSKLFLVYISGDDENSRKMNEMWSDERVQNMCTSSCIALKLHYKSEGCKQFSAIYPVLCIPSAYFIDNNGKITEALVFQANIDDFVDKIATITQAYMARMPETPGASDQPVTDEATGSDESRNDDAAVKQKPDGNEAGTSLEKLWKSPKQQNHQYDADEMKEEIKQERERREWGENVQKLREAQQEAKLKREREERKTIKFEEKAAKERVRRQIEQDKKDRAARYQKEKADRADAEAKAQYERREVQEEEMRKEQQKKNLYARLQFRMPDGSTLVQRFEATDVLRTAVEFVISQNLTSLNAANAFSLSVAFPRRVLTQMDHERTLTELDLVPSASLVVLPRSSRNISPSSGPSQALQLWSFLIFVLMIPIRLLQYVWSLIASRASSQQLHQFPANQSESTASVGDTLSLRRRPIERSTETRTMGNMTRLRDVSRDDDDNATWNGNSTQQM